MVWPSIDFNFIGLNNGKLDNFSLGIFPEHPIGFKHLITALIMELLLTDDNARIYKRLFHLFSFRISVQLNSDWDLFSNNFVRCSFHIDELYMFFLRRFQQS